MKILNGSKIIEACRIIVLITLVGAWCTDVFGYLGTLKSEYPHVPKSYDWMLPESKL